MADIPNIPIGSEYELSDGEQKIALRLARARYNNARRNGVKNIKMGEQSNAQTDKNGMGAEIAFCHMFGTKPDLGLALRSAKNGTDTYDTNFPQLNNVAVDVKHTDWSNGRLLAMLTKQTGDYLFALMNGCFPYFRFQGFAWAKQVIRDDNIRNLGHGRGYVFCGPLRTLEEVIEDEQYNAILHEDPRKTGLKNGLRQLTTDQLKRVIDYPGDMVLDSFNYADGNFCALAVGVGLDKMADPTHEKVYDALVGMGYSVYNTRGIQGDFYTTNRKEDLLAAAKEVLAEKEAAAIDTEPVFACATGCSTRS